MKKNMYLILFGLSNIFINCKNNDRVYNVNQQSDITSETKDGKKKFISTETNVSIYEECKLENFLEDSKISKIAKQLYKNTYKLKDDQPLELLNQLYNQNKYQRLFYFKAITNSYKISDGAYAEALGLAGKDYVEIKTKEFASNFDDEECFTKIDLETWSNIVMLEFQITEDSSSAKETIKNYSETLIKNCKSCTEKQKLIIDDFTIYITAKEKQYFNN